MICPDMEFDLFCTRIVYGEMWYMKTETQSNDTNAKPLGILIGATHLVAFALISSGCMDPHVSEGSAPTSKRHSRNVSYNRGRYRSRQNFYSWGAYQTPYIKSCLAAPPRDR